MNQRRRQDRLRDIRRIAQTLREDVHAPDLTDAIISRVHEQRPFLPAGSRSLLTWCKVGGVALIAAVAGVVVSIRLNVPEIQQASTPATPVVFEPAVDSVRLTASRTVEQLRCTVRSIERLSTEPLAGAGSRTAETGISDRVTSRTNSATECSAPAAAADHIELVVAPIVETDTEYAYLPMGMASGFRMSFTTLDGVPRAAGSPVSWQFDPRYSAGPKRSRLMLSAAYLRAARAAQPDRGVHLDRCCPLLEEFPAVITGQPAGEGQLPR